MVNQKRVLVLDDETAITDILGDFLEDVGYYVKCAHNGNDGLDILSEEEFDVIIVDMRLPDMSGNEFILRATKRQPDVVFFIHTGSLDYVIPDELIKIGIDDNSIIHKPVTDMGLIIRKIENS